MLVTRRALPGRRADVEAAWRAHMPAAVEAHPGHEAYAYHAGDDDPGVIVAYQRYADADAARAFLDDPGYRGFRDAVAGLLAGPPQVVRASTLWTLERDGAA